MEPIILRKLGVTSIGLVLMLLGSSWASSSTLLGRVQSEQIALPDGSTVALREGDLVRTTGESDRQEQLTFTLGRIVSAVAIPDGRLMYLYRDQKAGRLFTMLPDGTWSTLWPGLSDLSVTEFALARGGQLLVVDSASRVWAVAIADPFARRRALTVEEAVEMVDRHPVIDPLPSIVKPDKDTGYLFVIDIARTDDPTLHDLVREEIAALRVMRVEEGDSWTALAAVEPESDGSIYLEAPADTPLALEVINRDGRVVARTETPIWVRPNERRGCIGCHVSPAYAPPNVRPKALVKEPQRIGSVTEVSP